MTRLDDYSVTFYGLMFGDAARREAYSEALRRAIRPGAVVVDLGCGTGFFSLLACRLGASRVFAIERDEAIEVARELARANGLADRIEFLQDDSRRVRLPVPADVLVSDLRGGLPLHGEHIPTIADARRRFLSPGGALIPMRDSLHVALVEAPDVFERLVGPWRLRPEGLDLSGGERYVTSALQSGAVGPNHFLSEAVQWAALDYRTVTSPDVEGEVQVRAGRAGRATGLALWFEADLGYGVTFSAAPRSPVRLYRGPVLLFPDARPVRAGESVAVRLRASLVGGSYTWRWSARFPDGETVEQSTFFAAPLGASTLHAHSEAHAPDLGPDRLADARAVALLDGRATQGEVARALAAEFPDRFPTVQEALDHVVGLVRRLAG